MPAIKINEIDKQSDWEKFILPLSPNTFLQSWEWGQLNQGEGNQPVYLGVYENNLQIGAGLLIIVNARRGRFLFCPHGPVFNSTKNLSGGLPAFLKHCHRIARQEKAVALRVAPLLIKNKHNSKSFSKLGFRPAPLHIHAERTWNFDINKNKDKLLAEMRKTTRHAIKKAVRNPDLKTEVVTGPAIIDRFWPLYKTTSSRHQFTPFSKDFISSQVEIFSPANRIFMTICSHNGQDASAAIIVRYGQTAFYHHGASIKLPSSLPASHLVQWRAILESQKRNCQRYNLWGIAPKNSSSHPFSGITVFKTGFGGYDLDYLTTQDLPISPLYWKLWLVESWRRKKRGF